VTPGSTYTILVGAGGPGGINNLQAGNGGGGAVRVVYPGDTRTFPSTNVSSTTNETVR
jgi:hypothetical protein